LRARRRRGKARKTQPSGAEPAQRQLRERNGEAPQRAGGGKREDGFAVVNLHVNHHGGSGAKSSDDRALWR
jgi:hypothetical protein